MPKQFTFPLTVAIVLLSFFPQAYTQTCGSLVPSYTVNLTGNPNGTTATVIPSGGTPNYTYTWSNGQTTSTATGLAVGNYNVTITDANGCTKTRTFNITQPSPLTSTSSQINSCTGGNTASATVNPSGGTPNYAYLWNTGETTPTVTGLFTGNYMVRNRYEINSEHCSR